MSLSVEVQPYSSISGTVVLAENQPEQQLGRHASLPTGRELRRRYVVKREQERREGLYSPGELLPLDLDQSQIRQVFIDLGHKDIVHEVKNAYGEITQEGTPIDWYNPTQPFEDEGDTIMAVRFEPHDSELSLVAFIKEDKTTGRYSLDPTRPIIDMAQDPSVAFDSDGKPVLGVVRIDTDENGKIINYWTEQFRGDSIRHLEYFQRIPGKDNRPVQMPDKIRAHYRPQGEVGGAGMLAFRDYATWEEYKDDAVKFPLTEEDLIKVNFDYTNHGGANFPLPDGQIFGHIAEKEQNTNGDVVKLHYYAFWMLTDVETGRPLYLEDPETHELEPVIEIIADRDDFPADPALIPPKDTLRGDVIFVGGIRKLPDGKIEVTFGVVDGRIGKKVITDPMSKIDRSRLRRAA